MSTDSTGLVCRGCGSSDLVKLGDCPPFPEGNLAVLPASIDPESIRGSFYRCRTCSLGVREPCLNEEQLRVVYREMSVGQMVYEFETNGAWVAARDHLLDKWTKDEAPRVLDVGCNEGLFLAGLPGRWQKFGLESSLETSQQAQERGVEVIGGFLGEGGGEYRESFDVVCLFDVFEHLYRPSEGLLTSLEYLKPGGVLLVSTGDLNAWPLRWLGVSHWYLETPLHINIASRQYFQNLAGRIDCSFGVFVEVSHRIGTRRNSFTSTMETFYRGFAKRGGLWRIPQRLMLKYKSFSHLAHRTTAPFSVHIKDHFVVSLIKTTAQ